MSSAEYHLRYAIPCFEGEKRERLEEAIRRREFLDEKGLEDLTPKAINRIKSFADRIEYRGSFWDLEIVKRYWLEEHNRLIDAKEDGFDDEHHTDATRQFCKVSLAEVLGVRAEKMKYRVRADYLGREVELESLIMPNIGDRVTVHRGLVIEVLSPEEIQKFFPEALK